MSKQHAMVSGGNLAVAGLYESFGGDRDLNLNPPAPVVPTKVETLVCFVRCMV